MLDIIGVLRHEADYEKKRDYWKYLEAKFKRENNQLVVSLPSSNVLRRTEG